MQESGTDESIFGKAVNSRTGAAAPALFQFFLYVFVVSVFFGTALAGAGSDRAGLTGATHITANLPVSSNKIQPFFITPEEQAYLDSLKAHPIKFSYSYSLVQAEAGGRSFGMLDPMLDILRDEFGLTVNTVKLNWREVFVQIESGEVDFYGPIALSEARRQKYVTVDPFYRSYSKIMSRVNNPIRSMLGLYNRSVGLLDGSVITKTMQTYLGPYGKIVYFPTMEAMIEGLEVGTVDAFATVDNAEFELFEHKDIRFEFSIENSYVDQGLISGNSGMRTLAVLLNRYLESNPQMLDKVVDVRRRALMEFSKGRFVAEIAHIREKYEEIMVYSSAEYYPLSYMENGVIKGMLPEISAIFEELTGVRVKFLTDRDYPDGIVTALEKLKTGECKVLAGGYYDIGTWNDPGIEYSPPLWLETIRTYTYRETGGSLMGKTLGALHLSNDYVGWYNMTGNAPILYGSSRRLLAALKAGEVDAIFMGEMKFNYGYTILNDYSLHEVLGISAEATMHMLYGAQNSEVNVVFNKALLLYDILSPRAKGLWRSHGDKFKADYIRLRHLQQIWLTIAFIVFSAMFVLLIYLFIRVRQSLSMTKKHNIELVDKAHHDALTGIYNRRYLEENMKRLISSLSRSGGMLSLMMIDVDCFKKYNDTYGHKMGDECLKTIAGALFDNIARGSDFVARYGGEEFTVVLPTTEELGARLLAEKLLECIRNLKIPHETSDVADCVTISIGVITGHVDYLQKTDDYVVRADAMLYESKRGGRNRYNMGAF